ncbi:MAG: hypothetical protein R3F34_17490 [Planctomycetota bacterium]
MKQPDDDDTTTKATGRDKERAVERLVDAITAEWREDATRRKDEERARFDLD